jgi:hypothetical protein
LFPLRGRASQKLKEKKMRAIGGNGSYHKDALCIIAKQAKTG